LVGPFGEALFGDLGSYAQQCTFKKTTKKYQHTPKKNTNNMFLKLQKIPKIQKNPQFPQNTKNEKNI